MKIKHKIYLYIISIIIIVFVISIGIISNNYRKMSLKDARKLTDSYIRQSSNLAKSKLNHDYGIIKGFENAFSGISNINFKQREKMYHNILRKGLLKNAQYLSIWVSWELSEIDSTWKKPYGRYRTSAIKEYGEIKFYIDTPETTGHSYGSIYYKSKISRKDLLVDPYYYVYNKEKGDSILEASLGVPILEKDKFIGLIGIDVTLDWFDNLTEKIKPFDNSYSFMISNNGMIISHPNKKNIGKFYQEIFKDNDDKYEVLNKINNGEYFSFNSTDTLTNSLVYTSFAPITFGSVSTPWAIALVVPDSIIMEKAYRNFNISLFVGFIGLIILSILIIFISQMITNPLIQTTQILKDMDSGLIDKERKIKIKSKDEIGEMANSVNNLIDTLNNTVNFARRIGKGDLSAEYKALSKNDELGNALLEMRKNLIQAKKIEQERKIERKKYNWRQKGIANIGELLRLYSDDIGDFSQKIINSLTKYMKASQGGLYIIDEKDGKKYIELIASYAYDKKRRLQSIIEIGENLIGRCVQEKETIYITNVPEGYTYITSGLGENTPDSILIVPLIFEHEIYGAVELASFNKYEQFEIEFTKIIGERIASSISNIKRNTNASKLLEQSRRQSIELSRKEKESNEYINKLQQAREKALSKEAESVGVLDAISAFASVIHYDTLGNIIKIDNNNIQFDYLNELEIGKNHKEFDMAYENNPEWYYKFWLDLKNGKTRQRMLRLGYKDEELIKEIYTPIYSKSGEIDKIICIGISVNKINL